MRALLLFFSAAVLILGAARNCVGDGEHVEIDVKQLQSRYAGVSAHGTLAALAKLGLDVETRWEG